MILQFSAAVGPLECRLALLKIWEKFSQAADKAGLKIDFLHLHTGEKTGNEEKFAEEIPVFLEKILRDPLKYPELLPKSLSFSLETKDSKNSNCEQLETFIRDWEGSIQWICPSPLRTNHKRKNWFIGLKRFELQEKMSFSEQDLRFETMRASGAGGQHVNQTNSALRLTHIPSGLSVRVDSRRSQMQNKKLALMLLSAKIAEENFLRSNKDSQTKHQHHREINRGAAVKVFVGMDCVEKI